MRRRTFLGSALASALTACTASDPVDDIATSPTTDGAVPSTDPATTSETSAPTTTAEPEAIEPIEAPPVALTDRAFELGVASGDPDASSVVLWTRLSGNPPETVPVVWELATDETFSTLVATDLVEVGESTGHALHAIPSGLEAATHYWYRFRAGDEVSPVGRTKTLPEAGGVDPIRLAVSSCQDRGRGAYAAHADITAADVDLVLWLGDYIYGTASSLAEFRQLYADHRQDPLLRGCHAAHPWISIADDHEVRDDYDAGVDPALRAVAYRAWWENQPTRLPEPTTEQPDLVFYRTIDLGSMARLVLTDSRQYADATTLFGEDQLAFIEDAVQHDQRWTILASSVLASGLSVSEDVLLPYTLDGHPEERAALAGWLADSPSPLIVSGDLHLGMVLDFSADPTDPGAPVVATELMAPAISSSFPEEYAPYAPFLPLLNPHLRHIDVANGWLDLTLEMDEGTAVYRRVLDSANPTSTIETDEVFSLSP